MKGDEARYENLGYKFKAITLLHMLGYNSDVPADQVGAELLFAVGNVLEGTPVEDLDLRVINKSKLITEMQHG